MPRLSLFLAVLSLAPMAAADYPAWRGDGSGSAPDGGATLIDDLGAARLVWTSAEAIPDTYVADARSGAKASAGVGGGYAAPIVVGDAVYQFYYVPGGTAIDEAAAAKNHTRPEECWKILADDVLLCLDAATGATRWKAVQAAKGININAAFNKGGALLTPCHAGGRIFAVGTAGLLYAISAEDGSLLWETSIGSRRTESEAAIAEALQTGKLIYHNRDLGGATAHVAGVVATNDYAEFYTKRNGVGCGLVGFSAADGRTLWSVPACADWHAAPIAWRQGERGWFLIGNKDRITCVMADTGQVAWTCEQGGSGLAVAVAGDLMVCNGPRRTDGQKGLQRGLSAFRLSATGAEPLWSLPPETGYGSASPCIHHGRAIALAKDGLRCVDIADGTVLSRLEAPDVYASPVAADGRIVLHGGGKSDNPMQMYVLGEAGLAPAGRLEAVVVGNSTSAALADGRLYFRSRERLLCYDLRR